MAKPVAIKPEERFAVDYADRLILEQLTEMESVVKLGELAERLSDTGLGLAAVRALLASDSERFAYHERRWVPAARLQGEGRPLAEILALVLHGIGGAVSTDLLIAESARVRHTTPASVEPMVRRLVSSDGAFVPLGDGRVALAIWGFQANDETLARGPSPSTASPPMSSPPRRRRSGASTGARRTRSPGPWPPRRPCRSRPSGPPPTPRSTRTIPAGC